MQLNEARIAELLKPFLADNAQAPDSLSAGQLKCILMYIDILLRWNERINLTAVREPEEIVTRHFGESIFAARHLFPSADDSLRKTLHVTDVGSGAGFPGLPIRIWAPSIRLTLIESNQKKTTFLRETVRKLALGNIDVFTGRAESFSGPRADVVTLRAVERFETILPVAADLVGPQGRLAVLVGVGQVGKVRQLAPAFLWGAPITLPLSSERRVIIGSKNQGG